MEISFRCGRTEWILSGTDKLVIQSHNNHNNRNHNNDNNHNNNNNNHNNDNNHNHNNNNKNNNNNNHNNHNKNNKNKKLIIIIITKVYNHNHNYDNHNTKSNINHKNHKIGTKTFFGLTTSLPKSFEPFGKSVLLKCLPKRYFLSMSAYLNSHSI